MGVHQLWRLLDIFSLPTLPEQWRGKRLAVDSSVWIEQFRQAQSRAMSGSSWRMNASNGEWGEGDGDVQHRLLEGFLSRILKLLFYNIAPIFVFDGPSSKLKSHEVTRRRELREQRKRSTIVRQAKRILEQQISVGIINTQTLEALPTRCASPPKASRRASPLVRRSSPPVAAFKEHSLSPKKKVRDSPSKRFRLRRRERRITVIAPSQVSKATTLELLRLGAAHLEAKRRGDASNSANLLLSSRTTSSLASGGSSSLFLGSRSALLESFSGGGGTSYSALPAEGEEYEDVIALQAIPVEEMITSRCRSSQSTTTSAKRSDVDDVVILSGSEDEQADRDSTSQQLGVGSNESMHASQLSGMSPLQSSSSSSSSDDEDSDSVVVCTPPLRHTDCRTDAADNLDFDLVYQREDVNIISDSSNSVAIVETISPSVRETRPVERTEPKRMEAEEVRVSRKHATVDAIPMDLLELIELLRVCDCSFVISPGEADAQCAYLSKCGAVDGVFSEDSDVVVHGAGVVLRGFFSHATTSATIQRSLVQHAIDKWVLLCIALLVGCDYTAGVGMNVAEAVEVAAVCCSCPSETRDNHPACDDDDAASVSKCLRVLRCWLRLLRAAPHISSGDVDIVMEEENFSIAQRSAALALLLTTGKWNRFVKAVRAADGGGGTAPCDDDEGNNNVDCSWVRSFPSLQVALMFTEDVSVTAYPLRYRVPLPSPDWAALHRFMYSRGLMHLWAKAELAKRELEKAQQTAAVDAVWNMSRKSGEGDGALAIHNAISMSMLVQEGRSTSDQQEGRDTSLKNAVRFLSFCAHRCPIGPENDSSDLLT